jgi:hypothetical protein
VEELHGEDSRDDVGWTGEDLTVSPAASTSPGPPTGPAGYSGTPLYRKLGIKPAARVLAVGAPEGFDLGLLTPRGLDVELVAGTELPDGTVREELGFDVLLLFCPDAARLAELLVGGMAATARGGRCWVAWPKRASGLATDLTEDVVRDAALTLGWVDVKVVAVDRIWSGLCLMRRTSERSRSGG